ncbi:MAG TPA: hypothetical protein VND95_14905 [Stellaceae bacterium]|nr:hypothetical protein [Stellaceae bacterium]
MREPGIGRRWRAAALGLCACLLVAACAAGDNSAEQRHNGFYAGASGGMTRP